MNIELLHTFKYKCHDLKALLSGVKKLSTFCNRLKKQSELFPNRYDPDKYKGDGFELFAEFLIKSSPVDNRIGISNYSVILEGDVGVDGVGIGTNSEVATVQVKFRADSTHELTANKDHLSNFTSASMMHYKVNPESNKNMLIVTNAKGLHHFTDNEMFGNKVRCLGYEELRILVDNNLTFWNLFRESLEI